MPAPEDWAGDFHPERLLAPSLLSSQPPSSMLAASRMPQLRPPIADEEKADYNVHSRYGSTLPPASEEKMSGFSDSAQRLPSLSQMLNQQPPLQQIPATSLSHPLPPPPPPVLQAQPPSTSTHAASPFLERPSTRQERVYDDFQPLHVRTASEGQLRHREPFYDSWRGGSRDGQAPLLHPPRTADAPPPPPMSYHPNAIAPSSPQILGASINPATGIVHPPMQWHASQSPQSVSSSLAPGTTSLATAQKERPTTTRRLLGERNIPGEGRMFVYDDGTKIPTSVDGEPVNGQWGMTKAGRPRKRMPQACITCRQKKIKCDPGEGKCAQCEKSGKDCQYSHGQRGQKSNPTSPRTTGPGTPTAADEHPASPSHATIMRASNELKRRRSLSDERQYKHKRTFSSEEMFWSPGTSLKRSRAESDRGADTETERMMPSKRQQLAPQSETASPRWQESGSMRPVVSELVGYGCWAVGASPEGLVLDDPFETEREKATRYLRNFFERINSGTYCVFPRTAIMKWASGSRKKSRGELMTLYALLANGASFSLDSETQAKVDSDRYLRITRTAIETASERQGLQIILARMIVGHVYVIQADFMRLIEINDVCRAVKILKYDLSGRLERPDSDGLYDFGMNRDGLEELYRRTEWLAFLIDRYTAMNLNYPLCVHKEDMFLRLPCDESDYDLQLPTRTAFFDNGVISSSFTGHREEHTKQSPWSYFIQGLSFVSDIWVAATRSEWQDDADYPGNCDAFGRQTAYALERWYERLPPSMRINDMTMLDDSLRNGDLGLLVGIDALYHLGHMSLNRRVRHTLLPSSSIYLRVDAALSHAKQFLLTLKVVHAKLHNARRNHQSDAPWFTPVPFVRYAILTAVDILTACGSTRDLDDCNRLVDLCGAGVAFMEQLAILYASSRPQCMQMASRMKELKALLFPGSGSREAEGWICRNSLDPQTPKSMDLFYGEAGGVTEFILNVNKVDRRSMRIVEIQQERNTMGSLWGEAAGQRDVRSAT